MNALQFRKAIVFFLLLIAMWLPSDASGGQPPRELALKQKIAVHFGDARVLQAPLTLFGSDVEILVHPEKEGLRFTIPANRPHLDPVGVVMSSHIRGDFEITAGYEILQTTRPKTGHGIGFELYIDVQNPAQDAIAFTRTNRVNEGENYFCTRMTGRGGNRKYEVHSVPTATKRGWLRMTRRGDDVAFLVSERPSGPFSQVWRSSFVTDDLRMVRLAAYSGFDPAPFEIRMLDLRVASTDVMSPRPLVQAAESASPPVNPFTGQDPAQSSTPATFSLLQEGLTILGVFIAAGAAALLLWQLTPSRRNPLFKKSQGNLTGTGTANEKLGRPLVHFPAFSMIGVVLVIAACVLYANAAFAVVNGDTYRYFPPFKPYENANMNRHLGAEYLNIARSLAAGEGFANPFREPTGPTAWMPPVFPFLLAGLLWLCNGHIDAVMTVVVFVQALVLAGTGLLVLALTRQTAGRMATALAGIVFSAALVCDYHLHFQFTHDCWLILLTMDILLGGLCWARPLASSGAAAAWGAFGGMAALINPVIGFVWGVMTAWLAYRQRAWTRLALAGALAGCMLVPWTVRNYEVFGRLVPVKSNLAYELYQSQCLQPDGLIQLRSFATHPYANPGWERLEYKEKGEMAFLDHKREQFWQAVGDDPLDLADRAAYRFLGATVFYVPFQRDTEPQDRPWTFLLSRLTYPAPFVALIILLTAGIVGRLQPAQWIVMGIYAAYLAPYVAVSYYDRYAMPLLAVKALLAIWAIDLLCSFWRRPWSRAN